MTTKTTDAGYMATTENTNTERDLTQLGCYLEDRGGVWVVQYAEGGCMPASTTEKRLWNALQEARASLSLPAAGQEPIAYLWQHGGTGRTRVVMPDMIVDADAHWQVVGPMYLGAAPQPATEAQAPHGWLYDWTHSSATGRPDETYTGFTKDEQHARKHDNCTPVFTAPQSAVAAGWVSVDDRLPEPDEPVLAHNGKWTGVAAWMSGEYLEPLERWQDEHREFIEMMGPAITHWMPLPAPPIPASEAKGAT